MAECSKFKNNLSRCNCTYEPCSRKGHCCDCLSYHLSMGELPACAFTKDQESTYDRSIAHFVKTHR